MVVAYAAGGWAVGSQKCPDWEHARPAAVVNIEIPWLVTVGFILLAIGFLLQFLSVPSPKTIAQMRRDLKQAVTEEKIAKARGLR
jgi:hypothetical protein